MPAVFVHGVPDTSALWDPIRAELTRDDTFALRLPGFGEPIPDGFGCTKEEYAAWIADQLRALGEPVDLVGHDWGATFVQRVATTEPDVIRTYAVADGALGKKFKWHDIALQWQTPGAGKELMELMVPELVEAMMRDVGHPDPAGCAARIDDTMKQAILRLYRSAVDLGIEWHPDADAHTRPAFVLWGSEDPYANIARAYEVAAEADAEVVVVEGGHWAIFDDPKATARHLEEHWASL